MRLYSLTRYKLFWGGSLSLLAGCTPPKQAKPQCCAAAADPVLDTKALLAWNKDTVVLSFRGTASLANACSDIRVGPVLTAAVSAVGSAVIASLMTTLLVCRYSLCACRCS